jgi:hypothetical protein
MSKFFLSIITYLILSVLAYTSIQYGFFDGFLVYFLVTVTLFLIRDMILLFGVTLESTHTTIAWKKFFLSIRQRKLSLRLGILFLNRMIFFPFFLILYILLILLRQIDIASVKEFLLMYPSFEYILLGIVAFS